MEQLAAGKTLALLCATLAWQQQQAHAVPQQPDTPAPRVFWAARTHAQIDHAVHEVRFVHPDHDIRRVMASLSSQYI